MSDFNPRTRVGCDNQLRHWLCVKSISIHAPGWGATRVKKGEKEAITISIHAPGWGATG